MDTIIIFKQMQEKSNAELERIAISQNVTLSEIATRILQHRAKTKKIWSSLLLDAETDAALKEIQVLSD